MDCSMLMASTLASSAFLIYLELQHNQQSDKVAKLQSCWVSLLLSLQDTVGGGIDDKPAAAADAPSRATRAASRSRTSSAAAEVCW